MRNLNNLTEMEYINYTPHEIVLNDGRRYQSQGIARVSSSYTAIVNDECRVEYGEVSGLPVAKKDTKLIVSAMVLAASERSDLVAPATGHPDTIRNEKGHIISVPCFIAK